MDSGFAVPVRLALVFVLVCTSGAPTGAAPAELEPETRAARAHFRAGQAYFQAGDLRRALLEFQASQRDDWRPELDYNIGLTYDRLGDAARAIEAYRRFLVARPGSEEKALLQVRMVTLERSVGELVVLSKVIGATITVDDELLDVLHIGQPLRLTAGAHALAASKEGLFSSRATARVEAGKRIVVELDPRAAREAGLERRTKLGIGLGVAGGLLVVAGVALGVYFGTREPEPFDPGGTAGVIAVRPIALVVQLGAAR